MLRPPPISTRTDTLFPYTTLFRSHQLDAVTDERGGKLGEPRLVADGQEGAADGNQVGHLGGPRLAMGRRGPPSPAEPIRQPFERRSEEHTSELQSLMRISYAVLCLKTKMQDEENLTKQDTAQ